MKSELPLANSPIGDAQATWLVQKAAMVQLVAKPVKPSWLLAER